MRLAILTALSLLASPALAEDRWMSIPRPAPMPEAASTGMAPVNGIQMYYATYGAGDPVLLIHGGLGYADIWSAQVADLMTDHLVIVADSRGHGRSTRTEEPFGYDLMSSDYLALLDFLKIDKVDLVGWSDGGIIGIDIAMSHPERLKHLFAQAANITTDGVDPAVATDAVFGDYIGWMAEDYGTVSPTPTSSRPSWPRFPTCGRRNRTGPTLRWPRSPCRRRWLPVTRTRRSCDPTPKRSPR